MVVGILRVCRRAQWCRQNVQGVVVMSSEVGWRPASEPAVTSFSTLSPYTSALSLHICLLHPRIHSVPPSVPSNIQVVPPPSVPPDIHLVPPLSDASWYSIFTTTGQYFASNTLTSWYHSKSRPSQPFQSFLTLALQIVIWPRVLFIKDNIDITFKRQWWFTLW